MKNVLVSWEFPTTRKAGGVLPLDQISRVAVQLSADGGNTFSDPVNVTPPTANIPFNDLPFGSYAVRLVVHDTDGLTSDGVEMPFLVADDSAPGDVQNVTVTFP